jgi:ferrous iron transport protein B
MSPRFAATKIVENDEDIINKLELSQNELEMMEHSIEEMEKDCSTRSMRLHPRQICLR